jgi:peptidoglycan/xylan/chitin deacetylase (PgdA/CDA1 family)
MRIGTIIEKIASAKLIFLFRNKTVFPYYHLISNKEVAHIHNLYSFKNVSQFEKDLEFLLRNYKPLDPYLLKSNSKIPKNSFLLTFDDGLIETYTEIFPILKKHNLKSIFFLNPDFVDNKDAMYRHFMSVIHEELKKKGFPKKELDVISQILNFDFSTNSEFTKRFFALKFENRGKLLQVYDSLNFDKVSYLSTNKIFLNQSQIKEMLADGQFFGGHTMSHPPLIKLSIDEQVNQIVDSVRWVKSTFELDYSFFAFPFSDTGISKETFQRIFELIPEIRIFGNSGMKTDIDTRIIQRFSLENPSKFAGEQIVLENLRRIIDKIKSKNQIIRK